jgi:uncharacterized protein (DUF302 family)
MLYIKEAKGNLDAVMYRLKEATFANKFGIIEIINLKEKMTEKGVEFGHECRIVEVCNPHQAKKVLEANMSISTALPCRISVYEEDGKVKVATLKPSAVLSMFGNPELAPVAEEVERIILAIIDTACE